MGITQSRLLGGGAPISGAGSAGKTAATQADAVIALFGGVNKLVAALKVIGVDRNASTIYRWTYSAADGGTDGIIPARALRDVLRAAAKAGIVITPTDLYPTK